MAEWIQEAVAAEVEITNVAFEDDFAVDFEPHSIPIVDGNQLHYQVPIPRQHLLQTLQTIRSMRDDSIGLVRPIVNENFGKHRHFYRIALLLTVSIPKSTAIKTNCQSSSV